MRISRLIYSIFLLSLSFHLTAASKTTERINGVAEFLIDRANDNYLYIFQRKIQKNETLSCYFPTTFENLTVGGSTSLKRLLTSRDLWKESIQNDLEFLTIRSLAVEIESTLNVSEASVKIASSALDFIDLFQLDINGERYNLNVIDLTADQNIQGRINGFTYGLGQVVSDLNEFRRYQKLCPAPTINIDEFKRQFDSLRHLNDNLNDWVEHIEVNAADLRIKDSVANGSWQAVCEKLNVSGSDCFDGTSTIKAFKQNKLKELIDPNIIRNINIIKEAVDGIRNNKEQIINSAIRNAVCQKLEIADSQCTDKNTVIETVNEIVNADSVSNTGRIDTELLEKIKMISQVAALLPSSNEDVTSQVFQALKRLKSQIQIELTAKYNELESNLGVEDVLAQKQQELKSRLESFDKLSRHILFFASVADASTASEVISILASYTLPSVSFFEKREEGNHFMVTSYLGVSYNLDEEGQTEKSNNGLFVPIGLEYSRGVNWFDGNIRSASVMFSPVDFGHPINLKLNNIEEDFELDEIIAPSIAFSLGLEDYPLNFGIGYQKGRQLTASSETENRVILFFAFDMPLLSLYGD